MVWAKWHTVIFSGWYLLFLVPVFLVFRKRTLYALALLSLVGALVGLHRGSVVANNLARWQKLYGTTVQVIGQINQDPTYDAKGRRDYYVAQVRVGDQSLPGQLRVHSFGGSVSRGDTVQLNGKLYSGFGSYQGTLPFATVKVLSHSKNPIEHMRRQFFTGVYNALPDSQASLGLGFLVGLKTQLSPDFTQQLQMLALTHIVVASGYNLTILVRISRRVLARFSKFQALAGSIALMVGMLMVTGMSASMSRASIVTTLALLTWYYGRQVHAVLLLLLSAALIAWINPVYLWHDVGWWLSFMAFAGVLLLSPLIHHRFVQRAPPTLLGQVIIETLSAELLVEPIVMVVFGQFSVLGLLANVVVVPLIPLAMLLTFIAGLAGIFIPTAAGWLALPAKLVLNYVIGVIHWLSGIPWASQKITLHAEGLAVILGSIAIIGSCLYWRLKFRYYEQASIID